MDPYGRRKVFYRLSDPPTFDPDKSIEEVEEYEKLYGERDGWFHRWTDVSEFDSKSDRILIVANGIIEQEDGSLVDIPFRWIRFINHGE